MATTIPPAAGSDNTSPSSNPWSGIKLRHVKRPSIIRKPSLSSKRRRPPLHSRPSAEEAPVKLISSRDAKAQRPAAASATGVAGTPESTKVTDKIQALSRPATAVAPPAKAVRARKPAAAAAWSPASAKEAVKDADRVEARANVTDLVKNLQQQKKSGSSPGLTKNLVPSQPPTQQDVPPPKDNNNRLLIVTPQQKKPTLKPRPINVAQRRPPMPSSLPPPLPSPPDKREADAGASGHQELNKRASADSWIDIEDSLSPKRNESQLFHQINDRLFNMWKRPSKKKLSGGRKLGSQGAKPKKKGEDWETEEDSDEHSYEYIDFRDKNEEEYSDVIVLPGEGQPASQRKAFSVSSDESYEDVMLPPPKPPRKLDKQAENFTPVRPPRRSKEEKSKKKPILPPQNLPPATSHGIGRPSRNSRRLDDNYEVVDEYIDMDQPPPKTEESRRRSSTGASNTSNVSSSGSDPYIGVHQIASTPPHRQSMASDLDQQVYMDFDPDHAGGPTPRPQSYLNLGGLAELERIRQRQNCAAAAVGDRVSYVQPDRPVRPHSTASLQYEDPDKSVPPKLQVAQSQPNLKAPKRLGRKSRYVKQEPLFQNYQADFVERHRKSNKEEEEDSSVSIRIKTANNHLQSMQRTLWCELPEVKQSRVLQNLTDKQRKLQEAMFEVITSEASYLRSLNVLVNIFMSNPELSASGPLLNKIQFNHLFSNVSKVRDVSERFLLHLESRQQESIVIDDLCDIIKIHAEKYFSVYISYTKNQRYQDITLKQLLQESPRFKEVINTIEKDPECANQKLSSFLILPMQRITRLPLLIEAIFHRTEEGSRQYESATEAHIITKEVVRMCNEATREMERVQEMVEIQRQLKFDKIKGLGIISAARWVVKKGRLERIYEQTTGLLNKQKKVVKDFLHFFLFTDILIVCTQKKGDEDFVVMDHCVRSLIDVEVIEYVQPLSGQLPFPVPDNCNNLFRLGLLENFKGKSANFVLNASSLSERQRWMEAFSPGTAEDDDEKIYESWDCPQVQCIKRYKARQPDELDLEEADIVNIIKKLPDGWYEGIRVGDNCKGWFPSEVTEEIFNEHVKSRNLKLRNKLLMASEELIQNRKSLSNFI